MVQMSRYIIFADDDADDLELITGYFKQYEPSVSVLEFRNGKEVIGFLEEFALSRGLPQLLVLDMNMPKMNGKDTVLAIRRHPALKSLPVLIYSTSTGKEEEAFCKQHAVTWVNKPSNIEQVKYVAQVVADFCKQVPLKH
jgi:CheY-like chemotaxis protein